MDGSQGPNDDWTLTRPFKIPRDPEQGWSPSLNKSRSISSLLGLDPSDLYEAATFSLTEAHPEQYIIGLQVLVPNCKSYSKFYPSLALLGPLIDSNFPPVDETIAATLPFEIPYDYGAIIRSPPRTPQRAVYYVSPFDSYLLPSPLTIDCITSQEAFTQCNNGTAANTSIITDLLLTTPGKYYIVWWDPDRILMNKDDESVPREITISLGVSEEATLREQAIQRHIKYGQGAPRFSPCTGSFVAPPAFFDVSLFEAEPAAEPGTET